MNDKLVKDYTHDEIAEWGARRIKTMGYPFSFYNMTSATHGEQPDVLGLNAWANTLLIEVKTSRSDYHADKNKPCRKSPEAGLGGRRVYLTPEGLLSPSEIPYGWELWEIYGKAKPRLRIVKGMRSKLVKTSWGNTKKDFLVNCDTEEYTFFKKSATSYRVEAMWLLKILKRLDEDGIDISAYGNRKVLNK